jgi:ribosomal protein S27AE
MRRFDESLGCPKCGSGFVTTKHGSRYAVLQDEYLHRACERCGYLWREIPLDRDENDAKPPE